MYSVHGDDRRRFECVFVCVRVCASTTLVIHYANITHSLIWLFYRITNRRALSHTLYFTLLIFLSSWMNKDKRRRKNFQTTSLIRCIHMIVILFSAFFIFVVPLFTFARTKIKKKNTLTYTLMYCLSFEDF